jgi:hypothetical protein
MLNSIKSALPATLNTISTTSIIGAGVYGLSAIGKAAMHKGTQIALASRCIDPGAIIEQGAYSYQEFMQACLHHASDLSHKVSPALSESELYQGLLVGSALLSTAYFTQKVATFLSQKELHN